jgi:hypothetical protein
LPPPHILAITSQVRGVARHYPPLAATAVIAITDGANPLQQDIWPPENQILLMTVEQYHENQPQRGGMCWPRT